MTHQPPSIIQHPHSNCGGPAGFPTHSGHGRKWTRQSAPVPTVLGNHRSRVPRTHGLRTTCAESWGWGRVETLIGIPNAQACNEQNRKFSEINGLKTVFATNRAAIDRFRTILWDSKAGLWGHLLAKSRPLGAPKTARKITNTMFQKPFTFRFE